MMQHKSLYRVIALALLLASQSVSAAATVDSGKQMYLQYCSSCHGKDGKGDGAVSRDLKMRVPDLTAISKKHKGMYPLDDVMAAIDGRRSVRGHGERNMPVWGEAFLHEAEGKKYAERTALLKAKIIAEYIATLQQKN
jgi:mono/diheme cytochrome c family protein